jgi:hypothetical protein
MICIHHLFVYWKNPPKDAHFYSLGNTARNAAMIFSKPKYCNMHSNKYTFT